MSIQRVTARVLPVSPNGGVLLLQEQDPARPGELYWSSIGGAVDAGESLSEAAVRELREETGLDPERLYNVTVQAFYLHTTGVVQLAVAFAAVLTRPADVRLGEEHAEFEWVSAGEARTRYAWPREREAVDHIVKLLASGDAGAVEDVLRVR
jgi:8-oxo-dGTP pyrophosphatase MutT (NUDIX family)